MVRAMILGHEPRQARVAGEAYVRCTPSAGEENKNKNSNYRLNIIPCKSLIFSSDLYNQWSINENLLNNSKGLQCIFVICNDDYLLDFNGNVFIIYYFQF